MTGPGKLWIGCVVKVDGRDFQIGIVEAESVTVALAQIAEVMDELGSSPNQTPANALPTAPVEAGGKRTRRTKEQIAADEAAKAAANAPPALPSAPPPYSPPPAHPPITPAFAPGGGMSADGPPAPPLGGPQVQMTGAPPMPPAPPSVGFAAPPAPPALVASPEDLARGEVKIALAALFASVPAQWTETVTTALTGHYGVKVTEVAGFDLVQCSNAKQQIAACKAFYDAAPR